MDTLPSHLIREHIVGALSTVDALAMRMTAKMFVEPTNNIPIKLCEVETKQSAYWKWLYSVISCECLSCYPIRIYLFWMARKAGYRTVSGFFNSSKYYYLVKNFPSAFSDMTLGAAGQSDVRVMRAVRGAVPSYYHNYGVLLEACKANNTRMFQWLVYINVVPPIDNPDRADICIEIGRNGNRAMARAILDGVHDITSEMARLMVVHAMMNGHNHIVRTVKYHADLLGVFDITMLRSAILYDNITVFYACLESGSWPDADDARLVMDMQAAKIAEHWLILGLPADATVTHWLLSQ